MYIPFASPEDPVLLELPAEQELSAEGCFAALEDMAGVKISGAIRRQWPELLKLAATVAVAGHYRGRAPAITMVCTDGTAVSTPLYGMSQVGLTGWDCTCGVKRICVHRLGVGLALIWRDPKRRALLVAQPWRLDLVPLMEGAPEVAAAPEPPEGWIEVELLSAKEAELEEHARRVRLWLVPTSKRSGAPLKPRKLPKTLEGCQRHARLGPVCERLARNFEHWSLLAHVARYRYNDSAKVFDGIMRLEAELFSLLGEARSVVFQGEPVTVDLRPLTPQIILDDHRQGLALRWADPPQAVYPAGPGYLLSGHVLRPLAAHLSQAIKERLSQPLQVKIPTADVPDFLNEVAPALPLPLEVRAKRRVEVRAPVPVLRLADDDGALRVAAAFQYGPHQVAPGEGPSLLAPETPGAAPLARDHAAEASLLAAAAPHLPEPLPAVLEGDAAFDFLLEDLPRLEGWTIETDRHLAGRRVGRLRPSVSFAGGTDWFDVHARFELDDWEEVLEPAQVIAAWRAGRRYLRLKSGDVARLPDTWLARYGDTVDELEGLRKAHKGRLSAFAAPLAAGLLAEVDGETATARWRKIAERVRSFRGVPERAAPADLQADLRPYQHRGFRWLCALRDLGLGAVLADDMGLGKTVQTLALLLDTHARPGRPSLVIAPTSVIGEWQAQAERFAPRLKTHLHYGARRGPVPEDVDLVITSYALLRLDTEALAGPWRTVILDEAQAIKNPDSAVARAAGALPADHRLALTGTPLENHLIELWSLFHWLMPGFFAGQRGFRERYAKPIQESQDQDALEALRTRIRPFILRRLKAEVAPELPPRQVQVLRCELSERERALYEQVKATYRDQVLSRVQERGVAGATIQVLEALMRLRQAACDAGLLPFPEAQGLGRSAKRALALELIEELVAEGHRALVFSQWPSLLKRLAEDLDGAGLSYLYLDGGTTQRGALVDRFHQPDGPPLFLISLKAGGTGLNLTAADHVIHLDPWWNPAAEDQATDRAHRIGQTRPVLVYRLVAEGTVEEKILELQARKRQLASATVDAERQVVEALTQADLEAVFGSDAEPFAAPPAAPKAPRPALPAPESKGPESKEPESNGPEAPAPAGSEPRLPNVVWALLVSGGRLSNAVLRELLHLPDDRAARSQLNAWVEAGLIVRHGKARGTRYTLP